LKLEHLDKQSTNNNFVEIIVASGAGKVGMKRNLLLEKAKGDYVVFIDDDDTIADDYILEIMKAIEIQPDIICFEVMRFDRGIQDRVAKYSITYSGDSNTPRKYFRLPNHLMCVKREYAVATKFPEINFGEDSDYAKRLKPLLKTEVQIGKVLYNYLYDSRSSKTVNT